MSTILILHSRPLLSRHQAHNTHLKRSFNSGKKKKSSLYSSCKSQNGHLTGYIHPLSATSNELQKRLPNTVYFNTYKQKHSQSKFNLMLPSEPRSYELSNRLETKLLLKQNWAPHSGSVKKGNFWCLPELSALAAGG